MTSKDLSQKVCAPCYATSTHPCSHLCISITVGSISLFSGPECLSFFLSSARDSSAISRLVRHPTSWVVPPISREVFEIRILLCSIGQCCFGHWTGESMCFNFFRKIFLWLPPRRNLHTRSGKYDISTSHFLLCGPMSSFLMEWFITSKNMKNPLPYFL